MGEKIEKAMKSSDCEDGSLDELLKIKGRHSQEREKANCKLRNNQTIFSKQEEAKHPLKSVNEHREGKKEDKKPENDNGKRNHRKPKKHQKKTKSEMRAIGFSLALGFTLCLLT